MDGMILGPFFMVRRTLLDKTGWFDEQLKSGADFDLAMRMARCGKGMHIPMFLGIIWMRVWVKAPDPMASNLLKELWLNFAII